jgi:hypothetical protein
MPFRHRGPARAEGEVMPDKFELECALVTRLLEALGLSGVPSDPKKTYGRETGADVEVRLGARAA